MSWLNLNQSLNSLKGQITNIASEVFSESTVQEAGDDASKQDSSIVELKEKCRSLELENASLKKSVEELRASLQSERLTRKNGVKEEESNWYWDPSPQSSQPFDGESEHRYKTQIRALQDELSTLKERETIDLRPDEELNRLREENRNLSSNLEDLDSQHQAAMEKLLTLKTELQNNFEILKQEHEDLKNMNDAYAIEINTLRGKIGDSDKALEVIKTSKSDYDTLLHKYQNLERIHGLLRENAEKFQEENQELHEEVFKLQEQVTKLEHDIEIASKQSEISNTVPRQVYENLLKEINAIKERRNSNEIHFDEINIDDNAKSVIDSLRRDISDLKHKLAQKDNHDISNSKCIRPEKIMQLYNKYVNFELPIDYVGEIPSAGHNIVLYKLESVFKTINAFKKEIDGLDHNLSEKNLNTSHLQTQIDDLTTENDFLTTDIQHLERELSEMKKNNDFLISEIAALKNTSKLEPIIETHEDNLAKLETELADCNKLNKNFESEIMRIEKELLEVKNEKISLKESLNDLSRKYTTMLSEFEMCKNQSKEVEELENTAKTKEYEILKNTVHENDELYKRLNSANAKNEQLSIDIHILENDKVLLTKQLDDLRIAMEEKSVAYKELLTSKSSIENKLNEIENKLEAALIQKQELEQDKLRLEQNITAIEKELTESKSTNLDIIEKMTSERNLLIENNEALIQENLTYTAEIDRLRKDISELHCKEENSTMEANAVNEDVIKTYEQTINDLKAKILQQDVLKNELEVLKAENQKIIETKIQLETELVSTDSKIVHLEEEFEKLVADLNEKDSLIDGLNSTIAQNNTTLTNLSQTVTGLEKSLAVKNDELAKIEVTFENMTKQFNESVYVTDNIQQEIKKLQHEKEELSKNIITLNDEVQAKNIEITNLTSNLDKSDRLCVELNKSIDRKDKEIKELTQSIVELTDKIKSFENATYLNNDYEKVVQEKQVLENELSEVKNSLFEKENSLQELKEKEETLEKMRIECQTLVDQVNAEKTELINLINLKHNESIQYHNEIQRLNVVILEQNNEFKKIIEDKDKLIQNSLEVCANCERLRITLKEKDDIIISLNQKCNDYNKLKAEVLKANESAFHLKERCENLDKSMAIQLESVKTLTAQNLQLSEQGQNLERELERLRRHLMETEENYTQELMTSEQKLTECQARLHQVEERAKQTSTVYTSNSIRANQEVETLRNQIKLMERQRDEVQAKLSEAEDARGRSEAALTNLQVVLEQFQLDKERDIHSATEKIRNKMADLKRQNANLSGEIDRLNEKLEESLAGLQAATRLGDQVETKTAQINDLKEQVRTLQTSVSAAEERYYNAISNQQDKVDKNLVKNLVINYVLTSAGNHTNKTQVLRVISTVLDFNQQECERLGLVRSANTTDSLAAEFVKFLQNESRPRAQLPNMMTLGHNASRSTTPTSRKNSFIATPNPLPTKTGHSRNPSTGSSNLLFTNIDSMETASQRSRESDRTEPRVITPSLDTGVLQTRNTEGAILKSVLKDM